MRKQIMEILTEICPGIDFENEKALIDDGLIDSLDIVAVVTELMEAFDVELGVDDLAPENFNSVAAIEELVESRQSCDVLCLPALCGARHGRRRAVLSGSEAGAVGRAAAGKHGLLPGWRRQKRRLARAGRGTHVAGGTAA